MSDPPEPSRDEPTAPAVNSGTRLKAGDTLSGRFVIVQFLAQGGMGEVYEAADLHLQGKHHALKTLRSHVANDPAFRQRFEREVLLARDVNHPNVCPTYDLFQVHDATGPLTFLTMKLLRGESLQTRLQRVGRMEVSAVLPIAKQMANALDAAHQRGVVHRDFKPGNVMLDSSGLDVHVSITDFGLARAFASDANLAESGQILGTPGYIAPEVLRGGVASYQADVYAFGVVLYGMLTGGKPASDGDTPTFVPPSRLVPGTPETWDRVVLGCLETRPERRCRSAGEALALLDAPPSGARELAGASVARKPTRALVTVLGAVTLFAVTILALMFGRQVFDDIVHPLPEKRFVALTVWPMDVKGSNLALAGRTSEAVGGRLTRAEVTSKDFVIISASDVAGQASLKAPADALRLLGANLVLATSVTPEAGGHRLTLLLLDAATAKEIRHRSRAIPAWELGRLDDLAATAAAELLDVRLPSQRWKDQDELAAVQAALSQQFNAAEDLASQPNDAGLNQAIQKYRDILEANPKFALAYARVALVYARRYGVSKDPEALTLARRNAGRAVELNKDSVNAVLALATVDLSYGKTDDALDALQRALGLDPGNPQILLAKARAYRAKNRVKDEELVYREIIRNRPNFWPAYDQLGLSLYRQANYQQAAEAFKEGLVIAPRIVRMLNNLGAAQLALKQRSDAAETYRRSVAVTPTPTVYTNLGTLAFMAHDYANALANYQKSVEMDPKSAVAWRSIGDTFALLHDQPRVVESYTRAAAVTADALKTNPKNGDSWMALALYEAKLGHRTEAENAVRQADALGASTLPAQFRKVQALALLGHREEALSLLMDCLKRGQSLEDVELAVDLADLRRDPRYVRAADGVRAGK